jgi:hypothetical protein
LKNWSSHRRPGTWPDADMLPLGVLEMGKRATRFTPDEQRTLMTLWSIARSPLIMGGDLRKLDDFTASLLTNDEVLAVNQASSENREVFRDSGAAAWQAKTANGDTCIGIFNLSDAARPVPVSSTQFGLRGAMRCRDLWQQRDLGILRDSFAPDIPAHGAGLYRLSQA